MRCPPADGGLCVAVPRVARGAAGTCLRVGGGAARRRSAGRCRSEPIEAEQVVAELIANAEAGVVADPERALLRLRDRRRAAGGARGRLADVDLGPERRPRRAGPSAAVVEEVSLEWLRELLGLPRRRLGGLRHRLPDGARDRTGRRAAPGSPTARAGTSTPTACTARRDPRARRSSERHVTVDRALALPRHRHSARSRRSRRTSRDGFVAAELETPCLRAEGPTIVCAQAGNVNTGAVRSARGDCRPRAAAPVRGSMSTARSACGRAASRALRHLVDGVERADSWATDAHKWLNMPYDSGIAFCAHPEPIGPRWRFSASYLEQVDQGRLVATRWIGCPSSRGGRAGSPVYAAIRSLGRQGVAELVDAAATRRGSSPNSWPPRDGVEILNDVVLNQVLVRFADDDATTREVVQRVQEDGTCWLSGTTGRDVVRCGSRSRTGGRPSATSSAPRARS